MEKLTKPLSGYDLASVEKVDHSWFFRFTGEITIATESFWRLLQGRIIVISEDHLQRFGLPEPVDAAERIVTATAGRTVEQAAISPSSRDLSIHFNGGVQLQLLQTSSGYESWRLNVGGSQAICTGGGEIAHFPR